jgi:predicted Zn finger-like uncharacterized protein
MKPSIDARLLCRCSECNTVFRLAANQLAIHTGLISCRNCGTVFNAAWNLLDEIPNPVESSTPVTPIPTMRLDRDETPLKPDENEEDGPGFATNEHLFSLDDQLRQDLELGADDPGALEEIRRTFDTADLATRLETPRKRPNRPKRKVRQKNVAHRTRSGPQFVESAPPNHEIQLTASRRLMNRSSLGHQMRTQSLWLLAALMMVAGLFIQTRYWLFDELSAIPSARAPLEQFCRLAGCSVPAQLTGLAFRVLQTRVDLDPKLPGAVVVKVHLENRTPVPRPYPAIRLTLTDREGKTISKRTYTIGDYATTTDSDELRPNVVAVITLHLAGPDEKAVGFKASVVTTGT